MNGSLPAQTRPREERVIVQTAIKTKSDARLDQLTVGARARRRAAWRLLPFVFVLYIVNYIDRVNVSFASLRMGADLGLSDRMFGFGAAIFYVGYVFFEIPGAIIVERWSEEVDRANHDFVGAGHDPDRLHPHSERILRRSLFARNCRSQFLSRSGYLSYSLVPPTRAQPRLGLSLHGESDGLVDWLSTSRLVVERSLARHGRVAMVVYCRRNSSNPSWVDDNRLSDGLACTSGLAY